MIYTRFINNLKTYKINKNNKFKQKYKPENLSNIESLSIQKLKQQCENAKKILNWKAKYSLNDSIKLISYWHKEFLMKKNVLKIS